MTSTTPFPQFASWLVEHCSKSRLPFVAESGKALRSFLELDGDVPDNYGWRYSTVEVLKEIAKNVESVGEINRIYWEDFARNVEAYSITTYWRASEMIRPAVRSLNAKEYVASAVLARSLLELGATYLWNSNVVSNAVRRLEFPPDVIVTSEELERFMLKAMWGTRVGDPEDYLVQKNVLTIIQKVSKSHGAEDLLPMYEYLCEVAHPNVIGNARFWSHVDSINDDGTEVRTISRFTTPAESLRLLERTVWAISCGCSVTVNSFRMLSRAVRELLEKVRSS